MEFDAIVKAVGDFFANINPDDIKAAFDIVVKAVQDIIAVFNA